MKQQIRQFLRFLSVGLLNTGTTLGLIFCLIHFVHLAPLVANFLGYAAGISVSFTLNRRWTFKDQGSLTATGLRFLGAAGVSYLLNVIAIENALRLFAISIYPAQVVGNMVYTAAFFLLCRLWVFSNAPESKNAPSPWRTIRSAFRVPRVPGFSVLRAFVMVAMVVWLIDTTGFNPLDDHQFARTLFQGQPFGVYLNRELGRFYPLVAQEYVLISKWFGHEASVFYRISVLKLPIFGWLLALAIDRAGAKGLVAFLFWLLGIFSLGVAGTLFRLHAGDLNAAILLMGYLILMQDATCRESSAPGAKVWFGLLIAVAASLYKESIAILLLMFSGLEFVRLRFSGKTQVAFCHLPVFLYAVSFLLIYKLWAGSPGDSNYALAHQTPRLITLWRFLETNPPIFLLALPVVLIRVVSNGENWGRYRDFDSMLIASIGYVALFIFLGIYNQYYPLPGLGFALVGLAGIQSQIQKDRLLAKSLPLLAAFITLENGPAVLSEFAYQRQVIINHGKFIQFMAKWSPNHCQQSETACTIRLSGVPPAPDSEILKSLESFIQGSRMGHVNFKSDGGGPDRPDWQRLLEIGPKGTWVLENPYHEGPLLPAGPSLAPVFDSMNDTLLPGWRLHEWIQFCGFGRPTDCLDHVVAHARFAGYQLLIKTRDSLPPSPGVPLKHRVHQLTAGDFPGVMKPDEAYNLNVRVENTGDEAWPTDFGFSEPRPVHLAYRWLNAENGRLVREGNRVSIPETMLPGESFDATLRIAAPHAPGFYRLEVTMVQESVAWFPSHYVRDVVVTP